MHDAVSLHVPSVTAPVPPATLSAYVTPAMSNMTHEGFSDIPPWLDDLHQVYTIAHHVNLMVTDGMSTPSSTPRYPHCRQIHCEQLRSSIN